MPTNGLEDLCLQQGPWQRWSPMSVLQDAELGNSGYLVPKLEK